jgi:small-conductance mechanosensitive channel
MDINSLFVQVKTWLTTLGAFSLSFGKVHISFADVIQGVCVLVVVFWGAARLTKHLEQRIRGATGLSYNIRELLIKFLKLTVYFTAMVIGLNVVGIDITAFAVFGGALGVGLGLGLQKITANFVSGVTLLLEKSVKLGDYIQIGNDVQGFVRALNIRYTLIETSKGTEVLIPNETLTTSNVINWTLSDNKGRIEILFTVPYEADAARVKTLALKAASAHNKCLKDPAPNCFLKGFRDLGVEYMLVFWVADIADGLLGPQSDVMAQLMALFAENHITFANPLDKR